MTEPIHSETIDRRSGLTRREFVAEYVRPNKPVIFTDLTRDWPAREKYTLDYFRREHGDRVAHIEGTPYTLGDYINLLEHATEEHPAPSISAPSISVAADQLCHYNWDVFVRECADYSHRKPVMALAAKVYLHAAGRILDLKESLQGGL
ncbi:MAG: cupin-like domain-containing protein [Verrucomicrobia bacterium]|nr:cupin-like domain-containing protein [Verrucomicrobiota bacterium]